MLKHRFFIWKALSTLLAGDVGACLGGIGGEWSWLQGGDKREVGVASALAGLDKLQGSSAGEASLCASQVADPQCWDEGRGVFRIGEIPQRLQASSKRFGGKFARGADVEWSVPATPV
jgi:hypothetical protein